MKTRRDTHIICNGTGWVTCVSCGGTGKSLDVISFYPNRREVEKNCIFCHGRGKTECIGCFGKGYTESFEIEPPTFNFDVPYSPPMVNITSQSPTSTTPSQLSDSSGIIFVLVLLAISCGFMTYGFERMLVAAEGFFIFGGWAGLRAANLFRKQESEKLENFRVFMAVGFGLCCGFLATYLLLTTPEGQDITEWVIARTSRIVGSLFVSAIGLGMIELMWRKIVEFLE